MVENAHIKTFISLKMSSDLIDMTGTISPHRAHKKPNIVIIFSH